MIDASQWTVGHHDVALVGLSVVICLLGSLISARLLCRTIVDDGGQRGGLAFVGGIIAAATVWCTHFVAMLAYRPGMEIAYDVPLTTLSLVVTLIGNVIAFAIAAIRRPYTPLLGGVLFGLSTAGMHYLGMSAVAVEATMAHSASSVVAAVLSGSVIAGFAFSHIRTGSDSETLRVGALLASATIALHFTAMSGMTMAPLADGTIPLAHDHTESDLGIAIAAVMMVILATGIMVHMMDRQSRRAASERLRHYVNGAVDGMAVTQGGVIVDTNEAFAQMCGLPREAVLGRPISTFLDEDGVGVDRLPEGRIIDMRLHNANGSMRSIELTVRSDHLGRTAPPSIVYCARDITHRIAQEERIAYLAQHDGLTGLRNRAAFLERATTMLDWQGAHTRFAMLLIDLDFFKSINDSYGHAAGDEVLRSATSRLRGMLASTQIAARLGGDEFAVMTKMEDRKDVAALAEAIHDVFATPVYFDGAMLKCGSSIGIATFPEDGESVRGLLNSADLAMYRAKRAQMNHCFYDRSMDDRERNQRRLVDDLRRAIETNAIDVHYQVQMNLRENTVAGYEALARWNHPEQGPIAPAVFIPIAEEHGLIGGLGAQVLEKACSAAASWPDHLTVAVNLSPVELEDPGLVATVERALQRTGLDPARLELEVTEQCFVLDIEDAPHRIAALRELGLAISIDDFGAGYSSLSMLQRFPFDKIKLDKSFAQGIGGDRKGQKIMRAILSLAEMLRVPVVAEGVETIEQLTALRAEGCDLVQGHVFGLEVPGPPSFARPTTARHMADLPLTRSSPPALALPQAK
ncbi:EAL domain-containing protein [Acuticoccus sp. I52.16.1]|uniref:bifunctional diguanylate cyclase/phosphodiesterase n=1 Tax=Acuticoccus sp. I52.16.1 TaxID=2928472 RepID=UPI001FD1275B|nr:EAL domain-containing protein [Acuticoccus sp. I52.16.1]UOM35332.1 EAL domain-containing protein [Acuticoccus sp. I52.16.1]